MTFADHLSIALGPSSAGADIKEMQNKTCELSLLLAALIAASLNIHD